MGKNKLKSKTKNELDVPLKIGSIFKIKKNIFVFHESTKTWEPLLLGETLLLLEKPVKSQLDTKDILHLKFLTSKGDVTTRVDFENEIYLYLENLQS